MNLEHLKKSLEGTPIVKKGEYSYLVSPITDGIPEIKPELLEEVIHKMQELIEEKCGQIDKIVTIESMGIPLATALSLNLNIPFTIIRKRKYDLSDEISVEQVTGYSKSKLYINGLKKGDKIVIVDDVLSTGGTLRAIIAALKQIGVIIECILIAVDKGNASREIMDKFNLSITALVNVEVVDGKVTTKIT